MTPDIERKIEDDFPPAEREQVRSALAKLGEQLGRDGRSRILRCVLFLARGNRESLEHFIRCALEDWRDVIWWAEYDGGERHLRNFNAPFPARPRTP